MGTGICSTPGVTLTFTLLGFLSLSLSLTLGVRVVNSFKFPFQDPKLPWGKRVDDLVGRLTLEEMMVQMAQARGKTPGFSRLGIPPYSWDTECLSGDVQAGNATSFPMSLGLAATFSANLVYQVAEASSRETRAKYNYYKSKQMYGTHKGLSCFSPVVNIMRDPRWGRNQETYGEDPLLTSRLAASFVTGLQGQDPRYIRTNAGCKHFDVHGGPENIPTSRMSFSANVTERDWRTTFLPAFAACVKAGSFSIMCSYNSINGVPACANKKLLTDILRKELGFTGYVVSDQDAIKFTISAHKYFKNSVDAVAGCVNAGCNLDLTLHNGSVYLSMVDAVKQGKLAKDTVVERIKPLFYTRMRLGEFDPAELNPYATLSMSEVESSEHQELAVQAAMQSFVLMKNQGNLLPLTKHFTSVAIVGPMADNADQLYGDYSPDRVAGMTVTPRQGMSKLSQAVHFAAGCNQTRCADYDQAAIKDAVQGKQLVVVCLGTGRSLESEGKDRADISLPGKQLQLLQDAVTYGKGAPVILLLFNAGPLDISWAKSSPLVPVIMECFFPGQATGEALYRLLTRHGSNSVPAGRLPNTWPASLDQIPPITDYTMEGRTYRYFKGEPLYPFGYGLSYSQFQYITMFVPPTIRFGQQADVAVSLRNMGPYDADEVIQVYISWMNVSVPVPKLQLADFRRVPMKNGLTWEFYFHIKPEQMKVWNDAKGFVYEASTIIVYAGGQQPHQSTNVGSNVIKTSFELVP